MGFFSPNRRNHVHCVLMLISVKYIISFNICRANDRIIVRICLIFISWGNWRFCFLGNMRMRMVFLKLSRWSHFIANNINKGNQSVAALPHNKIKWYLIFKFISWVNIWKQPGADTVKAQIIKIGPLINFYHHRNEDWNDWQDIHIPVGVARHRSPCLHWMHG